MPDIRLSSSSAAKVLLAFILEKGHKPSSRNLAQDEPWQNARILRQYARKKETGVHAAADKNRKAFAAALSYAFAKGKAALGKNANAQLAARAVKKALEDVLPDVLLATIADGGQATAQRFRAAEFRAAKEPKATAQISMQFDASNDDAAAWARKHAAELAKGISDVTEERIREAVARAQEEGDLDELYDEIRDAVGDDARADMIARTESMRAANEGQREAWSQAVDEGLLTGNEKKEWIATEGACPECDELDGTVVDLDEEYPNDAGDGPPLHPNCRCTEGISAGSGRELEWRYAGGPGSGNFGHAGRPGEIGGSGEGGGHENAPYDRAPSPSERTPENTSWLVPEHEMPPYVGTDPNYEPPDTSAHKMVRDQGDWGGSHGGSQMITAAAAAQMGIKGYKGDPTERAGKVADKFLTEIAKDKVGSEETLYHGFQNVAGTAFQKGDTLDLPLTATSGSKTDSSGYGIRGEIKDQAGEPTIFEFEKGTPMMAYAKWSQHSSEGTNDQKEFGHVYSEAIVAGRFKVTDVKREVKSYPPQRDYQRQVAYGVALRVVTLKVTDTFDPATKKWVKR